MMKLLYSFLFIFVFSLESMETNDPVKKKSNKKHRNARREKTIIFLESFLNGQPLNSGNKKIDTQKSLKRAENYSPKKHSQRYLQDFLNGCSLRELINIEYYSDFKEYKHGTALAATIALKLFEEFNNGYDVISSVNAQEWQEIMNLRRQWKDAIHKDDKEKIEVLSKQCAIFSLKRQLPGYLIKLKTSLPLETK